MPYVKCAALSVSSYLCENPHVQISAVIITYNEEKKIADAIRSVAFADEILVVDSESTDRTREIAVELGARVLVRPWPGFALQKQFATDEATYDRVLSIDADERVTPALRDEISRIRDDPDPRDAYRIPRLAVYMGREIRHSGWYPDRQIRFFDRHRARWKQVLIHESVETAADATVGDFRGDLLHLTVDSPQEHLRMIRTRYAPMSAAAMHEGGRKGSIAKTWLLPPLTLLQTYLLKGGVLDGLPGARISLYAAYNVYLKHKLLREMQKK